MYLVSAVRYQPIGEIAELEGIVIPKYTTIILGCYFTKRGAKKAVASHGATTDDSCIGYEKISTIFTPATSVFLKIEMALSDFRWKYSRNKKWL